ncbi:MAG TPA: class I SAM-dependent methyltransferase [Planctomycetota bacterium]|nr:class I SAM-dependent methyltransferase [Planctomycetota bacterium]
MKMLFISAARGPDYQCDALFHGLRSLLDKDVVDCERMWCMYRKDVSPSIKQRLYGRGFTLYGLLDENPAIDRDDVRDKLKYRYFDYVVYGSIRRSQAFLEDVLQFYPANRIVFVDGEDEQRVIGDLVGKGWYFKRELVLQDQRLTPIQFAIPAEKIRKEVSAKSQLLATVIPGDLSTYIFDDEQKYYDDYGKSYFGMTKKKCGWDCLRHYEIMANACIPWFTDLSECPSQTMTTLPKRELLEWAARKVEGQTDGAIEACEWFRKYAEDKLSTLTLAKYVIDTVRESSMSTVLMSASGRGQSSPTAAEGLSLIETRFAKLKSTPGDINEHLDTLRRISSQCKHVTEFGTRMGVSTWALLAGRPGRLISIDIRSCPVEEIAGVAKGVDTSFEFIIADTASETLQTEETDFLFIDTMHTYRQLSAELRLHGHKVRHFLAFHGTVTFGKKGEMTKDEPGLIPAIPISAAVWRAWESSTWLKSAVAFMAGQNGLILKSRKPRAGAAGRARSPSSRRGHARTGVSRHFGSAEVHPGWAIMLKTARKARSFGRRAQRASGLCAKEGVWKNAGCWWPAMS